MVQTDKSWWARVLPYLFIAPTLILVMLFTLYPAAKSFQASLYKPARRAADPSTFVGLDNFEKIFDPEHVIGQDFTIIFQNTLVFALTTVMVSMPLALLFALLVNRKIQALGLWRFSLYYPALLPMIGAASLWAFLFADTIGVISVVLKGLGVESPNWTGDPDSALWVITAVNIWKQASFYMIFYLAGLQGIPRDLYEAADLDGADWWQSLSLITIPLLRRTTVFVSIVAFTFSFQSVEHLPVLGSGGPGVSSNLMLFYIFQKIAERRNWGYVNAMTVVLVLILMIFTVTNLWFSERGQEDERA